MEHQYVKGQLHSDAQSHLYPHHNSCGPLLISILRAHIALALGLQGLKLWCGGQIDSDMIQNMPENSFLLLQVHPYLPQTKKSNIISFSISNERMIKQMQNTEHYTIDCLVCFEGKTKQDCFKQTLQHIIKFKYEFERFQRCLFLFSLFAVVASPRPNRYPGKIILNKVQHKAYVTSLYLSQFFFLAWCRHHRET